MNKKDWNYVCICGCGEPIPKPKRMNAIPRFKRNHWWNIPEYAEKIRQSNIKRTKKVPNISPCVGRRFRGGKYFSRALMEEKLKRKLLPSEHVHHINGDKTDDRIENLSIIDIHNHTSLHKATSPIIKYKCDGCGIVFKRKKWKSSKTSNRNFCNITCWRMNGKLRSF